MIDKISKLKLKQIEADLGDNIIVSWRGIQLNKMSKRELITLVSHIEQKRSLIEKEKNALELHMKLNNLKYRRWA